jgi:hypothetical protein
MAGRENIVRVFAEVAAVTPNTTMALITNTIKQRTVCFAIIPTFIIV